MKHSRKCVYLSGLKYLENVIDITISETNITLKLRQASDKYPLQTASNDGNPVDFGKHLYVKH